MAQETYQTSLNSLTGDDLEKFGYEIFTKIGLRCFYKFPQIKLSTLTSGYSSDKNFELDYIIPENQVCLIGEITSRGENNIKAKYKKFIDIVNIIKGLELSREVWLKLGITQDNLSYFKEIESIRAFFIITGKERCDGEVELSPIEDIAIFYRSDFLRLIDYAETIGKWTKPYFLNNFSIESKSNESLTIPQNSLIVSREQKIGGEGIDRCNLYTFIESPYNLLDIAHVYRKDELPSLEIHQGNYQRPLINEKLKDIRKKLLIDRDFMFPSNILVILSKECYLSKDPTGNRYLYIPKKYKSISVIDGQHRLFSYADDTLKERIQNECKILVTAIDFLSNDERVISESSAKIFIEINMNQTKVEIPLMDSVSYDWGDSSPKTIATKIIEELNKRSKFSSFFDLKLGNISSGIVEAGTIIESVKKITNITTIKRLKNPRVKTTRNKKDGYEKLFQKDISLLCDREILVESGIIFFERYFNLISKVFKHDKPLDVQDAQKKKSSLVYSKFWGGLVNLLIYFINDGLDWQQVESELNKIKLNIMFIREFKEYNQPLFDPEHPDIPDATSTPKKIGDFLNENRKNSCSIQDIK